ncbi:methyl-CpG-binding domain protein 5/6 homolog sba isoform X2 [Chironomus tepperi]|uniref:methyl-CpG-binding domain protein 5/6 homolog sba isoform X2 n=1 Tax=Chironomus tepperi TaxID=113505 RepID=UPI00391FAB56
MSAVNNLILKATDCDAVKSGLNISKVCLLKESEIKKTIKSAIDNNGTKLNDSQPENFYVESIETNRSSSKSKKQESSIESNIHLQDENTSDVQKVLEQEQELQKQLYSGANVANGWFRVNHVNKVIYISPSGIGFTSLKQVKNYLLTRGTCKCGLPFPLRVELFFNFDINVPNVPLKTPIEDIKYDPNCQHKKKLITSSQTEKNHVNASNNLHQQKIVNLRYKKTKECLLPSYVTSVNNKIRQSSMCNSSESAFNKNNNKIATNNIQQIVMQSKSQQTQFLQQIDPQNMSNLVNVRIVKEENDISENSKLPPWRKNVMQNQFGNNSKSIQPTIISTSTAHGGIPIFQFNGQMITIDQNQQFSNQPQKIQIFEQKSADDEKMIIRKRPPTFKEDPTAYLNQQTALLHNTITTLHSPDVTTSMVSPTIQENSTEFQQRSQRHIVQQVIKTPNIPNQQFSSISGQTLTQNMSMSNAIVQIRNCDITQQQQTKLSTLQDQQKLRTNPKGRPPKHSRRLVSVSQESPVSSSTTNSDITSSSAEAITETVVQSTNNFDRSEVLKYVRNSSTQEVIRTSMTPVLAGKTACLTTPSSSNFSIRKPTSTITSIQKKPQTIVTQMKTNSNSSINNNNNNSLINQLNNSSNQQVMMTSNGQQFIVMPSSNLQAQPQNIVLNNNSIVQIQNSNPNHPRLIQTTGSGQNGNIIIQTNNGNLLATTQTNPNNFIVNGQPLIFQNNQIIQSNSNLIASQKNNVLLTGGATTSTPKSLFGGNNHLTLGQQSVLLQNSLIPQSATILNDSTYLQNFAQQQKVILNPEKKKGRKRKNPLSDSSAHQQATQQSSLIQIPTTATPQSFHISTPNIFVQNKFSHPTTTNTGQQIILQNGQTFIQQPMNFIGNQQIIPSQLMTLSSDGNSFVQIQNPSFNNIMTAPQNIIRTGPTQQHLQPVQKTIITNNGQQYIVQGGGHVNLMNQLPFNSMGFVVQSAAHQNQQQQQIINPIVIQSQGQQIMTQPQILTQTPGHLTTQLAPQQAQFLNQNDYNNKIQRKIMLQHKTQQQNSFFPQIINKATRTGMPMHYASSSKNSNSTFIQNVIEEHENLEEDEENLDLVEQDEELECEEEADELELSFDEKPDMIEELHHGTSQQILHSSSMIDGQCGIMNIDDITIEMDEINDLNEYLNAIDEEDNKISQIGLSSLQHFANSPPDTTTHSPRSPVEVVTNVHHVLFSGSEKSNGSSESNNMVSSSELDSNVISPECHQFIDAPLSHQHLNHTGTSQPIFKLPLEPRSSNIRSPPLYSMINTTNYFDNNTQSPLRPDSHGGEN